MSDKSSEKMKKTECCDQKGCCPSASDDATKPPDGGKKWWKIAVFTLGVFLIIGATAYSLITRHTSASSKPLDNSGIPQVASSTCARAIASLGIGDLVWAQELNAIFTNHDLVFVILPENDSNSTNTLVNRISDATAKIEARGARVGTLTLNASDPEFSITMQRLALGQLPAVLALSTTGNGAIVTGDITEGKLLQTYVTISQPVCAPGSSSGCCPK